MIVETHGLFRMTKDIRQDIEDRHLDMKIFDIIYTNKYGKINDKIAGAYNLADEMPLPGFRR